MLGTSCEHSHAQTAELGKPEFQVLLLLHEIISSSIALVLYQQ